LRQRGEKETEEKERRVDRGNDKGEEKERRR